jgi:TonB family protein
MHHILSLLVVFSVCASSTSVAQDNQVRDRANTEQAVAVNKKPKNEVESMLEDARKRGETIIHTCLENCEEDPGANTVEDQGFEKGRFVILPKPPYPRIARAAGISGNVIVQVIIDVDGNVIAASIASGHPLFHAVCLQAARESIFTTSRLDGVPVKVTGVIRYGFKTKPRDPIQP